MSKQKLMAIYIRVSKDKLEQKTSIENQKQQFIQYANDNNYKIFDFYTDIDSGTLANRPDFERLLQDAQQKKFDIIASKEVSRLCRNVELAYKLKRITEDYNIDLITAEGAINTLENNHELFGLFSWLAEYEAQRTGQRLKAMLLTRAKNGLFNGSIPPYGYYCKEGRLFLRNDDTPEIVKRIFREYISGKGIDTIAKGLYTENIQTPSQIACKKDASNIWYGKTVKNILTNQAYIGNMEQKKERTINSISKKRIKNDASNIVLIEDTHEPIISKEDFYIVQDLLKSRSKERGHQAVNLFTNLLRCGDCGKGMHFKKYRKGYVCATYAKLGKNICDSHFIKESNLTETILGEINLFISSHKNLNALTINYMQLESVHEKKITKIESAINSNKAKLKKINQRKYNAFNLLTDGTIPKNEYIVFTSKYDEEIELLSKEIRNLQSSLKTLNDSSTIKKIREFKEAEVKIETLTPDILNKFIDKIEISKEGNLKIYYRFKSNI